MTRDFRPQAILSILLTAFLLAPEIASAQEYIRLNGLSPFYCNYLPNGKTQLAIRTKAGKFRKISFDAGREQSADRKAALRSKQKDLNVFRNKLIKESQKIEIGFRELTPQEKKLILFFGNGFEKPPEPLTDTTIRGAIDRIAQISQDLQAALEFQNLERNQIKDCEKKVLPPFDTLTINYDLLIAEDKGQQSLRWSGLGIAYLKMPKFLLTAGPNANAVCLTFANGSKRYVAFNYDPMGVLDSILSYASNHILVTSGETGRLLKRDEKNFVTEWGYVFDDFADGSSSSTREGIESRYERALPPVVAKWGNSVRAERPVYSKATKTWSCR